MPLPKAPSKPAAILAMNPNAKPLIASRSTASSTATHEAANAKPSAPVSQLKVTASVASPVPADSKTMAASTSGASKKAGKQANVQATAANAANLGRKLFVLDTNVLMHDPSSLFRFAEHDVFLPMMTLEELDNNKKGMSEVARNARQVSRALDGLVAGDQTESGSHRIARNAA